MSSGSKILSTKGEVLSFNSRADIEPWLKDVDPTIIEEVHFGRSTIGVDAAIALGEFLNKTTVLKVSI
jgi:Ran GTPase-activating protein 1